MFSLLFILFFAADLAYAVLKYVLSQSKTADPEWLAGILKTGLSEDEAMGTFIEYLIEQNKDAWVQSGLGQGIQRGIQKGEGTLLTYLLEHKFKSLPVRYKQEIESARSDRLLTWGKRVLECQTLEEVFD